MKLKTYIILLSKVFLKGHPRAGEETNFKELFLSGSKLHTIRDNYEYWKRIIIEVQQGIAILSVRQWSGKAYNSKQEILKDLTAADEIGIQQLDCDKPFALEIDDKPLKYQPEMIELAKNDGLEYNDFDAWFNIEKATGQKAIIQFTSFRY